MYILKRQITLEQDTGYHDLSPGSQRTILLLCNKFLKPPSTDGSTLVSRHTTEMCYEVANVGTVCRQIIVRYLFSPRILFVVY